jgi:hypothetical protein
MLQANELRIGNYFIDTIGAYANPNTIQQVESIDNNGVNTWQDMSASGCCPFDKMKPIPLTPEILEKCGFKKRRGGAYGIIWHKERIDIIKDEDKLYYRQFQRLPIRYLHQLQNLYYALTGEELEVHL